MKEAETLPFKKGFVKMMNLKPQNLMKHSNITLREQMYMDNILFQ